MKTVLNYLKVFAIIIASFVVFSTLSCFLPYKSIQKNVEKSLPELIEEGNYPKTILNGYKYRQDNFTDALILNIVVSSNSQRPVWSAMINPFSAQSPEDPDGCYAIKNLDYKLKHFEILPNIFYGRYWHGSAAVCKILLLVMDYQHLKWFLYIVSSLLLLLFAVRIVNRAGWIKSLPIFLSLLFANFFVTQFSIQFFPVMAISLIGGIWMCGKRTKSLNKASMCLFLAGMFTAYFDLLTAPLLTLGLPLLVYMILHSEEKKTIREIFKTIFILCIIWFIGYAGAWAMKWFFASLFADANTINAINAVKYRTTTDDYTRWDAIVHNFYLIPVVWLNIVLTLLLLLTLFCFNKKGIRWAVAFLMIALLPYIWYFVLANHSYLHWWFTYRAQIISMSCAMLFFVSLIDWGRLKFKIKIQ